jgi:hypothetical protein
MFKRIHFLFVLTLWTISTQAQFIKFSGNVRDTVTKQDLPNVVLMAVKFNDSTLIGFTRSTKNGFFKPIKVPLDTYIVMLSHPAFGEKTYILAPGIADSVINFKNVILPPKTVSLNEVEIIAYREKTYYKGDTLVFTADSFKTSANASVEDLLKKLPGFRVDATGKITVQGKQVDQVLVDGDEFFGGDPTIATRNLNAASIENVQVYDKKNENTGEEANETLKVVNLKMKDDAKKGYFGKASVGGDHNGFYENDLLANKFKGNRKTSIFGLMANTPKQAFNWSESQKYGLSNEQQWSYDEESGNWNSNREERTGIPQTIKSGFYFSDKFGKNTKTNSDYTFNRNRLSAGSETNTQYFLKDTSFSNRRIVSSNSENYSHNFNLRMTHKLDSLTELTVAPRLKYITTSNTAVKEDNFISAASDLTRKTIVNDSNNNAITDGNILLKLSRNFGKKDRNLTLTYQPSYYAFQNNIRLKTDFKYFSSDLADSISDQRRTQEQTREEHNASFVYTEPWTNKIKTELSYHFGYNKTGSRQQTYDVATGTDIFNPVLSNNFDNSRLINRFGTKFIYDVKKYQISVGGNVRNIRQQNTNLSNGQELHLVVDNILPYASFLYRINQGANFSLRYNSNSQQPDLRQMQPVIDNTDPNYITVGNPDLIPTFRNSFNVNYYSYKGISELYFWSGGNFSNTSNQISFATSYDSIGRAISKPINVDGNFNGNIWIGGGHPLFKRFMKVFYSLNSSHSNNVSFLNDLRNLTKTTTIGPGITLEKSVEKFEFELEGHYDYTIPETNISQLSVQPYYTYRINGNVMVKLPKKITLHADGNYTNNGNRTPGYNLNYIIVNASVNKAFLKNENLLVGFSANDIFNQNINNRRTVSGNQIIDHKTQVIRRYFLLRLTYKFNSQKAKPDEED